MGRGMVLLKAVMPNGVEDNGNFSIQGIVLQDYRLKMLYSEGDTKNNISGKKQGAKRPVFLGSFGSTKGVTI